jgi:hypothetical protein
MGHRLAEETNRGTWTFGVLHLYDISDPTVDITMKDRFVFRKPISFVTRTYEDVWVFLRVLYGRPTIGNEKPLSNS